MKSYKHLWDKFISHENISLAIDNSSKHKRKRNEVRKIYQNKEKYINPIQKSLISGFKNDKHIPKEIYDGIQRKKRTIIVPTYREQIVHHALVNILKPIFWKGMYEHSYGSLPNRGGHKGKKTIEKWIKKDFKNTKYYLKMDIKKYFDSIPHDILKRKLSNIIRDKKFLDVLFEVIDVTDNGLPLGFYTSQWLANWYLTELDHYIKEELNVKYYIRYMDDMVIFGSNKRQLHDVQLKIEAYLNNFLGLNMKENWQVVRFDNGNCKGRDLDFMGFRFYRNKTTLRKGILLKATRKARRIKKNGVTIHSCRQMLSYIGWLSCTDTYNYYLKHIKPCVDFGRLKQYCSRYDKKQKKEAMLCLGKS